MFVNRFSGVKRKERTQSTDPGPDSIGGGERPIAAEREARKETDGTIEISGNQCLEVWSGNTDVWRKIDHQKR